MKNEKKMYLVFDYQSDLVVTDNNGNKIKVNLGKIKGFFPLFDNLKDAEKYAEEQGGSDILPLIIKKY